MTTYVCLQLPPPIFTVFGAIIISGKTIGLQPLPVGMDPPCPVYSIVIEWRQRSLGDFARPWAPMAIKPLAMVAMELYQRLRQSSHCQVIDSKR